MQGTAGPLSPLPLSGSHLFPPPFFLFGFDTSLPNKDFPLFVFNDDQAPLFPSSYTLNSRVPPPPPISFLTLIPLGGRDPFFPPLHGEL